MIRPDLRVVFLHIPKTAGQTVHSELTRLLSPDATSPIRVHTQVPAGTTQFPAGYRLYSGHLDWQALGDVPAPRFVFTVLRNPLERIASFYYYLKAQAAKLDAAELSTPARTGMRMISLNSANDYFFGGDRNWQQFIRDHYDNVQATYLATGLIRGWAQAKDLDAEALVARALAARDKIDAIYSTTNLQALEDALEKQLGQRPRISNQRINAGPHGDDLRWPRLAAELGPEAADRLAQYAHADALLMQRLGLSV